METRLHTMGARVQTMGTRLYTMGTHLETIGTRLQLRRRGVFGANINWVESSSDEQHRAATMKNRYNLQNR